MVMVKGVYLMTRVDDRGVGCSKYLVVRSLLPGHRIALYQRSSMYTRSCTLLTLNYRCCGRAALVVFNFCVFCFVSCLSCLSAPSVEKRRNNICCLLNIVCMMKHTPGLHMFSTTHGRMWSRSCLVFCTQVRCHACAVFSLQGMSELGTERDSYGGYGSDGYTNGSDSPGAQSGWERAWMRQRDDAR